MDLRTKTIGAFFASVLCAAGGVFAGSVAQPVHAVLPEKLGGLEMAQARLDKRKATAGHWKITQVGTEMLPDDTTLSIQFEGPNAIFFGGCNTIQTLALFGSTQFRFEVGGATKKICSDEIMAQEAALLAAIENVDLLSVPEAGVLGFYDRENKLILAALRADES